MDGLWASDFNDDGSARWGSRWPIGACSVGGYCVGSPKGCGSGSSHWQRAATSPFAIEMGGKGVLVHMGHGVDNSVDSSMNVLRARAPIGYSGL